MRLLIVTGLMRSGTSLCAEMLHYLGSPAGVSQLMPQFPTWQNEWEDYALTNRLLNLFPIDDPKPTAERKEQFRDFFEGYVRWRGNFIHHMDRVWRQRTGTFTLKSPLLALVHDDVCSIADSLKLDHRTIICRRAPEEVESSIDRAFPSKLRSKARGLNKLIGAHLSTIKPEVEFNHADAIANPDKWAVLLQSHVGGYPFANRLHMATSKVRRCPQPS